MSDATKRAHEAFTVFLKTLDKVSPGIRTDSVSIMKLSVSQVRAAIDAAVKEAEERGNKRGRDHVAFYADEHTRKGAEQMRERAARQVKSRDDTAAIRHLSLTEDGDD